MDECADGHTSTLVFNSLRNARLSFLERISEHTCRTLQYYGMADCDTGDSGVSACVAAHAYYGTGVVGYRVVRVPVSVGLYRRVVDREEGCYGSEDVYDMLKYLVFMDDVHFIAKMVYLHVVEHADGDIARAIRTGSSAAGNGQCLHADGRIDCAIRTGSSAADSGQFDISSAFLLVIKEVEKNYFLCLTDKAGNIIRTDHCDGRMPLVVDIDAACTVSHMITCIAADYASLQPNMDMLVSVMNDGAGTDCDIEIDIDFSLYMQHGRLAVQYKNIGVIFDNLCIILYNDLFCHSRVCAITVRICDIICDFNFKDVNHRIRRLHCTNCLFVTDAVLDGITDLHIYGSVINASMRMPKSVEQLVMENVKMVAGTRVDVDSTCKRVMITGGDHSRVSMSQVRVHGFDYNFEYRTFKLVRSGVFSGNCAHASMSIDELCIYDACINCDMVLAQNIRSIHLRSISVVDGCRIEIVKKCEKVVIDNCRGIFYLPYIAGFRKINMNRGWTGTFRYVPSERAHNRHTLYVSYVEVCSSVVLDEPLESISLSFINCEDGADIQITSDCQHIKLEQCRNTTCTGSTIDIGQVSSTEWYYYEHQRSNMYVSVELTYRTERSLFVSSNTTLSSVHRLCLTYVDIDGLLNINREYDMVMIRKCKGRVKVPGIVLSDSSLFSMLTHRYSITSHRITGDVFDLKINDLTLKGKNTIDMSTRLLYLRDICIEENATLSLKRMCMYLVLDRVSGALFKPLNCTIRKIICLHTVFESQLFNTGSKIDKFVILHSNASVPISCDAGEIYIMYTVVDLHCILRINAMCDTVFIIRCVGDFDVPGIASAQMQQNVMYFDRRSEMHFYRCKCSDSTTNGTTDVVLFLKDVEVSSPLDINDRITDVRLCNITCKNDAEIYTNRHCKHLSIINCDIPVNIDEHCELLSLKVVNTKMMIGSNISRTIKKLYMADVKIIATITYTNLKEAYFYNVDVMPMCVVSFDNIQSVHIHRCHGTFSIPGIAISMFNRETTLSFVRKDNHVCLQLFNITLSEDVELCNDITMLELMDVCSTQIIVGKMCKAIRLSSVTGRIDISRANKIGNIVLCYSLPVIQDNIMVFGNDTAMVNENEIILPSTCKQLCLEFVSDESYTMIRAPGCSSLSLIRCDGTFNLACLDGIDTLLFDPLPETKIDIAFPVLGNIRTLTVVYNYNTRYFEYLLFKCTNVVDLTIYSIKTTKDDDFCKSIDRQWQKKVRREYKNRYKQDIYRVIEMMKKIQYETTILNMLNTKMNEMAKHIFNSRAYNRLIHLRICGFCFDKHNSKLMKNFVFLKRLSINYEFVNDDLLMNIPPNIECLEIVSSAGSSNSFLAFPICTKYFDRTITDNGLAHLRDHKRIRTLIIHGQFFSDIHRFNYLPTNLETLALSYFEYTEITVNITKKVISKLVVYKTDNYTARELLNKRYKMNNDFIDGVSLDFINNIFDREYYGPFFNYLSNFIRYDCLESISLVPYKKVADLYK